MSLSAGALLQTTRKKILINKQFPTEKTIIAPNQSVYIPSVINGPTIYSFHNGLEIGAGSVFTPSNRCKGMCLVVKHKLTINGTISMTAKGATAPGDKIAIDYKNGQILTNPSNLAQYEWIVGDIGGASTSGVGGWSGQWYNWSGVNGKAGVNGACGGGGAGACSLYNCTVYSGGGSAGTSYSGGAGGGGASIHNWNVSAISGEANGGAGGNAYSSWNGTNARGAGGGAGNPGGASSSAGGGSSIAGESGTGGLLIILVYGDVEIGSTGIIESNGSKGGYSTAYYEKSGGGGSGAGSITLLYTGNLINNGTIRANGGSGGSGDFIGGAGGAGSIRISKIII